MELNQRESIHSRSYPVNAATPPRSTEERANLPWQMRVGATLAGLGAREEGTAGAVDTHVAVNAVDDVLGGQVGDLGVCLYEDVRERVDEVLPLLLRETVHGLCRQAHIRL